MSRYPLQRKTPNNYRTKEIQLMMSLKFHHAETLSDIPLEVAMKAMVKVWESCQKRSDDQENNVIHL